MSQNNLISPNNGILTPEKEELLLAPIQEHMNALQQKIDALRQDGTTKISEINNTIKIIHGDKNFSKQEQEQQIARLKGELEKAKAVESANKAQVDKLVA